MSSQKQTSYETTPYGQWEEFVEVNEHFQEQFGVRLRPRDSSTHRNRPSAQEFMAAAGIFLAFVLFVIKR